MTTDLVFIKQYQQRNQAALSAAVRGNCHAKLQTAMLYTLNAPSKHFRPVLMYCLAHDLNLPLDQVDPAATAIELIHTYSLIHDDLPAMDDDDLRRGQNSNHIEFDEATAILAGDALLTLAFEQLNDIASVKVIAHAAGHQGMVGGQALDLAAEGQAISLDQLKDIHQKKTGALITACCHCVAIANQADPAPFIQLGAAIGLAFQVQDDILDVTQDSKTLGKNAGSDLQQEKATFVSLLGLAQAQTTLTQLKTTIDTCLQQLACAQGQTAALITWLFQRNF